MAGLQHGAGPRPAGGDGAEQLGVAQGYGPPSHRLGATRRAGSRDGVRRLRAILARLERPAQEGVREVRSEEHTSELQSQFHLVCRLLLEKKKKKPEQSKRHIRTLDRNRT